MSQRAVEQAQKLKSLLTPAKNTGSSISIGSKRKADEDVDASPNGEPPVKVCQRDAIEKICIVFFEYLFA